LQPLAATWQPLAPSATCPVSHLPLAATWQPLGSHLQPLTATCPVSHLQPLAATWQPLGRHLLQWLQQVAAKWLQVAHISKIKLRTSCTHNGIYSELMGKKRTIQNA